MAGLTWLHLSDWHQRGEDFDREVVLDALIDDIRERTKLSADLARLNFIAFSGDVAFGGKPEEYKAAIKLLFDPVLEATEMKPDQLFIAPGNHDLDIDAFEYLPKPASKLFTTDAEAKKWLTDEKGRARLLDPFEAYSKFVTDYTGQDSPDYANIR